MSIRSGITEEEMGQIKKLLTSVRELEDGKVKRQSSSTVDSKSSRKEGERIQQNALEGIDDTESGVGDIEESDMTGEDDPGVIKVVKRKATIHDDQVGVNSTTTPPVIKRPKQRNELVEYLENKNKVIEIY